MRNLDLLIPKVAIPNDWWTWGTITGTSPLRVRLDGDTDPLDATPENLVGYLVVGDRVWVQMSGRRAIVTAVNGGEHTEQRLTALEDDQALLWDSVAGQEADIEAHDTAITNLQTATADSGWVSMTVGGGWSHFGGGYANAACRKIGNLVRVRGMVKDGAAGNTICTLPTGFRPTYTSLQSGILNFIGKSTSTVSSHQHTVNVNQIAVRITVSSTGTITLQDSGVATYDTGFLSLESISFFID